MKTQSEADFTSRLRGLNIPPCPAILTELSAELRKDGGSPQLIATLIRRDVALSAAVLQIANSASLGVSHKVSSISEAISLLGSQRLVNLVVSELIQRTLSVPKHPTMERFWDRAAHYANVCALLAERLRGTHRETAYCFGLLHDCGIPLMMQRYPDYKDTLRLANLSEESFTNTEDARHGTDHATMGYLLTRSWGLADTLSEAIRSHHEFEVLNTVVDRGVGDEACTLIALNLIAEHIVGTFLRNPEEHEWQRAVALVASFFGLVLTDLDDLVEDVLFLLEQRAA